VVKIVGGLFFNPFFPWGIFGHFWLFPFFIFIWQINQLGEPSWQAFGIEEY